MYLLLVFLSFYPVKVKNPKKALLYSSILPAGGQIYNGDYLKGTIIGGLEIFCIGSGYVNYRESLKYQPFSTNWYFYRRGAFSYTLYFLGVYLYSLADAYISAHLHDAFRYFKKGDRVK